MHIQTVETAQQSIHHMHRLIQSLFTNAHGEGQNALEPLMSAFDPQFSMVTTSGAIISRAQVETLFKGAIGARPGLEIVLSDLQTIWQAGSSVAIRYRETHHLDQQQSSRVSLAIIAIHDNRAQWLSLQETCAA